MNMQQVQPIRSVGLSAPRYRYIVEKNPPMHVIDGGPEKNRIRQKKPIVMRIPLGLWCKAVTGHKLDTERSVAKSDGEICHPCTLCRALVGTGIYMQTIVTDNSEPLVTLS